MKIAPSAEIMITRPSDRTLADKTPLAWLWELLTCRQSRVAGINNYDQNKLHTMNASVTIKLVYALQWSRLISATPKALYDLRWFEKRSKTNETN
jgi:hypothetical protein